MVQQLTFGIDAYGFSYGEPMNVSEVASHYVNDPAKVMQWGVESFYCADNATSAVDLATEAAKQALERSDMVASEIDLIVVATSEMPEYLYWDSSAALARELGIERVKTMLLNNEGCGAGLKSFSQIAGALAIDAELQTVLLVAVNRVSEYHRNRMKINDTVHSDAAVAAIIKRDQIRHQWLATEHFAYPEFCDFFRGDYGGAKHPTAPKSWSADKENGYLRLHNHFKNDLQRMRKFTLVERKERIIEVIETACKSAKISTKDLTHIVYINDARPGIIEELANEFEIPIDHTNLELAKVQGHMGTADQLMSLGLLSEQAKVKAGDIIALCGISTGMQWCCTLIRA